MTPPEMLDALCAMTAGELDYVVAKLALPTHFLSGAAAAPATRAAEVVRALEAHHRLADLEAMLRPAGTVAPPRAPEVSIARLPATNRELFGREAELAWLDGCWKEGVRVASIIAFGGMGKTSLVNAWLAKMDADGWRGARRVYAWSFYDQGTDRLSSSDEFVDAALRWFGDPDDPDLNQGSAWDKGERLAGLVKKERSLLILDGVEPLQRWERGVQEGKLKEDALVALVKELGAQNMGLCLITSRITVADLNAVGGDKVRAKDLADLSPEAGAELLKARGAKGTEEELQAASTEYGGHGLALTLLGSYLEDVAEGDIRRRRVIGPLEEDERHGGHARRVMAAYEVWLGRPEIAILHMIGLFDRLVEEDEIAALRAEPTVPGLTEALVGVESRAWNKAVAKLGRVGLLLVVQEKQDMRLDAHPLVREHFGEQLKREQPEAWREGHRRLYEHLKRKAKELPDTLKEMAPLHAAMVHGCLAGRNQEALDTVFKPRIYRGDENFNWKRLGDFGSEMAVLSAFFDPPWERLVPGLNESDQTFVEKQAAHALHMLGRLPESAELRRMSLKRHTAQKNWSEATISAWHLSELLRVRGKLKPNEALAQAREFMKLADMIGSVYWSSISRVTLAATLHAMGVWEQVAGPFEEAERMQGEYQPDYPLLYTSRGFHYCDFLLDQGRGDDVRKRAAQTLQWAQEPWAWLPDAPLDSVSLGRAHLLAAQRGNVADLAPAASYLKQAVDGLRRAGIQDLLPHGILARATLHTHTRAFDLARKDLDEALSTATRCGFRLHEADAHLGHARLSLAETDPTAAREHLAVARRIITETGYHRRDGELAEIEAACR